MIHIQIVFDEMIAVHLRLNKIVGIKRNTSIKLLTIKSYVPKNQTINEFFNKSISFFRDTITSLCFALPRCANFIRNYLLNKHKNILIIINESVSISVCVKNVQKHCLLNATLLRSINGDT